MQIPTNLPDDLNAEVLLEFLFKHYPADSIIVNFSGLHKRNAYKDIMSLTKESESQMKLTLGRNSLYNSLPEYLFHPIDRFDNLSDIDKEEQYREELYKQRQEIKQAYAFFEPFDIRLLQLRLEARKVVEQYAYGNKVLINILSDQLTVEQRENELINKTLVFLPLCKHIRGNRTLLTFMLRKALMDEELSIEVAQRCRMYHDDKPRYLYMLGAEDEEVYPQLDGESDSKNVYVGNEFEEQTLIYDIEFWNEDACDEHFLEYVKKVDELRAFVNDYFMSIDSILVFRLQKIVSELDLFDPDKKQFNYLNYNTNL